MLSRVADSVFWMSRYVERAENVARFIDVNLNLQIDLPLEPAYQWQPLIDTAGDTEGFKERFGEATEQKVIQFLTFDHENPPLDDAMRGTPATNTWSALSGSTHSRPNHQPYVA